MTKLGEEEGRERDRRCRWCRRRLGAPTKGAGRPREYCRRSCRQRAYEARRRVLTLGLSADLCLVRTTELDRLHELARAFDAAWLSFEAAVEGAGWSSEAAGATSPPTPKRPPPDLAALGQALAELAVRAEPLRSLVVVPSLD